MYKYEDFCRGKLVSGFTTAPSTIDIEEDDDFPGDNRFPTSGQFAVSIWTEDEDSPQQDPNRATAVLEHSEENTYNVIEFNEFGTIDFSAGDYVALVAISSSLENLVPYTGADSNVDLGTNILSAGGITVDGTAGYNATTDMGTADTDFSSKKYVDDEVATKAETANAMGSINHGADADTARPTGYNSITWIGTVEPTNATNDDIWIDVS